jgi:hypothetical protein
MQLNWNRCNNNTIWCDLNRVNLDHEHFNGLGGVYIIWHTGTNPATVRVGQGVIRDRLAAHRQDNEVQAYVSFGLRVTWASVSESFRDGVEAYLAQTLNPLVGQRFPNVTPIEVNLPW